MGLRKSSGRSHFIYLVQAGQFYKIGISQNPYIRLTSIITNCPLSAKLLYVIKGDLRKEAELHKIFRRFKVHGEWFRGRVEILNKFQAMYLHQRAMNFCDYCPCDECQLGNKHLSHACTEEGTWICTTCYYYECCIDATRDTCEDLNCGHRPILTTEWIPFEENK